MPEDLELDYYSQRVELKARWHAKADIRAERRRAFTAPPRIVPA